MRSKIKKFEFIILLSVLTSSAFGQQFLWSTLKADSLGVKYVPLENVTGKVLEFYDHYQYYYDGAGFGKDGFVKFFESSQSFKNTDISRWKEIKKKIYQINSLTVFALRDNLGQGSVILVICISKENVNLISFSNTYERDAMVILPSERQKFESWFKTLLE